MTDLNFDFNTIEKEEEFVSKFFEPGVHLVKITKIEQGVNSQKQTPYIEVHVTDIATGTKECHKRYQLAAGALVISAQAFVGMVAAVNNLDNKDEAQHTKAKTMLGVTNSVEALVTKLSTLLVGKEFAGRFTGEWYNPTDVTKKSYVQAVFGSYFAYPKSKLSTIKPYDPSNKYDLKGTPAGLPAEAKTATATSW